MNICSLSRNIIGRILNKLKNTVKYFQISSLRKQIDVRGNEETLDFIIRNHCSVSRYGDGEFNMILEYLKDADKEGNGSDYGFQKYNPVLAKRLYDIVSEGQQNINHIVCIPYWFRKGLEVYKKPVRNYCKNYLAYNLKQLIKILNLRRTYYNANMTRFYLSFIDKSHCRSHVENLKKIWYGRDICMIEGEKSRLGIGNDLFSNAKSLKRILCPSVNAFDKYDEILNGILENVNRECLLILALGHTATVLAYDLARYGYQALDLGHIDIEYEWMRMGATQKVPIPNKYVNEASGGNKVSDCPDESYQKQIILRVE